MNLYELAFACYMYKFMAGFDESYTDYLSTTQNSTNLSLINHREALLAWLNKWGCRQFAQKSHEIASQEILLWYSEYEGVLLNYKNRKIQELSDAELTNIPEMFDGLSGKKASIVNNKNNSALIKTVGPTGAAKILFAIEPDVFIPWDIPMREKFGYDGSGNSYVEYLKYVKGMINEIRQECSNYSVSIEDLPDHIDRPQSSLTKLIDEYHWITITKRCEPPARHTLDEWCAWINAKQ